MVIEVGSVFCHIDLLVEIADFYSPSPTILGGSTKSNKNSILIISSLCPPVCVTQMEKNFIPSNKRERRFGIH